MEYSFSFSEKLQQEWHWSLRYAGQPEILRYVNHVAGCFDLQRDITFNTGDASAEYDESSYRLIITTEQCEQVTCRYCVMAVGCLSTAQMPSIPGLDSFRGSWYHTGHWQHEGVGFSGQRVGIN